jgi:hypothetical protein
LSRTPTASTNNVTIARFGSQAWTMYPTATGNITIDPAINATVPVYLVLRRNNTSGNRTIQVDLQCYAGGAPVGTILTNTRTINLTYTQVMEVFNLSTATPPWTTPITCGTGNNWVLTVTNTAAVPNDSMRVYVTNATLGRSRVDLPASTVINVDDITFHTDSYTNGGGSTVTTLATGSQVWIQALVSDPFGSYDISGATLLLTDSAGTVRVGTAPATPVAMSQAFDSGAATKIYEYGPYTIPSAGPAGGWTARVVAAEGTEGTVSDFGLQGLTVTLPPPSLTFLKTVATESDPVNGSSGPQPIPGAWLRYTLLVTNSGAGAVDNDSLVISDPLPASTSLFVNDLGDGSPVLFADGDADSGFAAPQPFTLSYFTDAACTAAGVPSPDGAGFDGNIRCFRINMTGTMNGAVAPATTEFSLTFRVRLD